MRRHDVVPGLTTLLLACSVASALANPAAKAESSALSGLPPPPPRASDPRAHALRPDSSRLLHRSPAGMDPILLRLRRAAAEHRLDNARGVVDWLEPLDFSTPSFPEAGRAAFLLAQAYRRLGSTRQFVELARAVSGWDRRDVYVAWLERELATIESDGIVFGAPGPGMTPERATAIEAALGLGLEPGLLSAASRDEEPALAELSRVDTTSLLGRDLAGAALVRRAAHRLARGEDPVPLLEAVPAGSRHASAARHLLGLTLLERGDARGPAVLGALLDSDSTYSARREVRLLLAARELEAGRWEDAERQYAAADADAARERDDLGRIRTAARFDSLWTAWRANGAGVDALTLDPAPLVAGAQRLADASARLDAPPPTDPPPVAVPAGRTMSASAPAPSPEEWRSVTASAQGRDEAQERASRARDAVEREQTRLAAVRRYFSDGRVQVWHATMALESHARQLDSLNTSLKGLDTRLRAVRDQARTRVLERARELLARCEAHAVWNGAMDRLYLQGPHRERPLPVPTGYPSPDSVLAAERALTEALRALVTRIEAEWPELIARSYQNAWRPGLIDRVPVQSAEAGRLLAAFDALDASIAARIVSLAGLDSLRAMEAHATRLTQSADSLDRAHRALESRVARSALDRALLALGADREAIDYGLATTAYALSVRLSASDTAAAASARAEEAHAVVLGAGAGRDSARTAAEDQGLDDPQAAAWRARAIPRLQAFLERHPRSEARADVRFRLADLLLVQERQQFRDGMARFVRDQSQGGAERVPLPVLSPEPALALYRAILTDDPGFAHRDAVLFNAGTILADQGDPASDELFRRLVEQHPNSRYTAEAYLRLGDLRFDDRRFAESVPMYQRAAAGGDPTLRAISLYKLGWAHFNGERFDDAAEAFRSVLDVYDSTHAAMQVDLQNEAESYLVHTLARAGGAAAFDRHFQGTGSRPYERRVLRSLGHHFRRYSLYAEAAATERLVLSRYPLEPDALAAADRLIETYRRWDRAEETRAARLECAPRFAPGSEWARAQASDSVRAAGATFARSVWTAAAFEHHRRAREKGGREDWREALRLYELLLATFPNDPTNPALELDAGEACAKLGDHALALKHYGLAAQTGADSVASQAAWQRVAVADAWYESTRPPATATSGTKAQPKAGTKTKPAAAKPAPRGVGRDSLARLVLANADELLKRFPDHPQGADLMWRQGQLSLAHQWDERAAQDFARLFESRPTDSRAPLAVGLRADALFRLARYEDAGTAYEQAAAAAKRAGLDSLERRASRAVPVCAYRRAEAAVAADSSDHGKHAQLFEAVATGWPSYEHAGRAQYRAGLGYLAANDKGSAVRALWVVIRKFGKSEYVRDAYLQIAKAEEARGERRRSADAYAEFADRYPADPSAGPAWLQAAEHYEAEGLVARADTLRLAYVRRHPDDVETGIQVYETLARRELAAVGVERPISTLLPPVRKGKPAPAPSHLAQYLKRAAARPDLASKNLIAQVRFLEGEEARTPYLAAKLKQPLEKSIPAKQKLLEPVLARYRKAVDQGVPEWAHASTYRIGESLVAFGDALERSERPADLKGEDLDAYDEVIGQQAQAFYDRGEAVWTELLKPKPQAPKPEDRWMVLAQESLWKRLGTRFAYLPEAEFPRVEAKEPESRQQETPKAAPAEPKKSRASDGNTRGGGSRQARAERSAGGSPR